MNEIQYQELLTMEFALRDSLSRASAYCARLEKTIDPESCLHKIARDQERELISSIEICEKVVKTLSKNGLYTHTDRK
jgi:hypothetical protein